MFSAVLDSIKLFLKGKLFRDTGAVIKKYLLGVLIAAAVIVGASYLVPMKAAVAIGALLAGAIQPLLFKDLKYA